MLDRATLQKQLATAERHVVLGEQHLLRQMERQLDGHMAEYDWLLEQLLQK